jgi:hypothetical protein
MEKILKKKLEKEKKTNSKKKLGIKFDRKKPNDDDLKNNYKK